MINKTHLQAEGAIARERTAKHPLALELIVNCAACGHVLNAEVVNGEIEIGTQILICVEKCTCIPTRDDDDEYELSEALQKIDPERLKAILSESLARTRYE